MDVGRSRVWAGAPPGGIPNESIEVLIVRRVCSRTPRLSKVRMGRWIAALSSSTPRDLAPRSATCTVSHWPAFAHITPKFSCKRVK